MVTDEDVTAPNANEAFEVVGDLYYRRFHVLRPGKDSPAECHENSSSDENRERFGTWLQRQAFGDAIARIVRLSKEKEQLEARLDRVADLLDEGAYGMATDEARHG